MLRSRGRCKAPLPCKLTIVLYWTLLALEAAGECNPTSMIAGNGIGDNSDSRLLRSGYVVKYIYIYVYIYIYIYMCVYVYV